MATVSASIVTFNSAGVVGDALQSLLTQTKEYPLSVYVVDNHSTDHTLS